MESFLKTFFPSLLAILSVLTPVCLVAPVYADNTYSGKDCSKYVDAYGDPIQDTYNLCMENGGYDSTKADLTGTIKISSDCRNFLGMVSWDCHTIENVSSESDLTTNVITIAANVFVDITVIASYLVLGYVIYGGYLYMFSDGDPGKAAAGKKTLLHAFTGLAIVVFASVILNAIRIAFLGNNGAFDNCLNEACVNGGELVSNLISWVIGISGVVSVVFVVIGGVGYVTSTGEPAKLQKAKSTILYALIGLAIVGLAQLITAFVSNIINNA